jgi:hypothetical protein
MGFFARLFGDPRAVRTMKQIVGAQHICTVSAYYDDPASYVSIVEAIVKIGGGALVPTSVECKDARDETYELVVQVKQRVFRGSIDCEDVFIDVSGILDVLNDAVQDQPGRFVTFDVDNDDMRAFAYGTREQLALAQKRGLATYPDLDELWETEHIG